MASGQDLATPVALADSLLSEQLLAVCLECIDAASADNPPALLSVAVTVASAGGAASVILLRTISAWSELPCRCSGAACSRTPCVRSRITDAVPPALAALIATRSLARDILHPTHRNESRRPSACWGRYGLSSPS